MTHPLVRGFYFGLALKTAYHLFDDGLSRLLALETLTHGTGPYGYIGINLRGADPNFENPLYPSTRARVNATFLDSSKRYFYLFKDTDFRTKICFADDQTICENTRKILPYVKYLYPKQYAMQSGMKTFNLTSLSPTANSFLGEITGLMTPTLKFRFPLEEVQCVEADGREPEPNQCARCRFEEDPDYNGLAYRTSEPISPLHLGVTGSLSQGLNAKMFSRMAKNPSKVYYGGFLCLQALAVGRLSLQILTQPLPSLFRLPQSVRERASQVKCISLLFAGVIYNLLA